MSWPSVRRLPLEAGSARMLQGAFWPEQPHSESESGVRVELSTCDVTNAQEDRCWMPVGSPEPEWPAWADTVNRLLHVQCVLSMRALFPQWFLVFCGAFLYPLCHLLFVLLFVSFFLTPWKGTVLAAILAN